MKKNTTNMTKAQLTSQKHNKHDKNTTNMKIAQLT